MQFDSQCLKGGLLISAVSLCFLSGCDGRSTQKFTSNGAVPVSSSSSASEVSSVELDCESTALSAVGVYDASYYGSSGVKISTQWLYIDGDRKASLYVDQNSEPGQVANNCYSGGEFEGRNYGLGSYYGAIVSDGACVLHTGLSHTAHLNLKIQEAVGVVSIRAFETGVEETNEDYVENWVVDEGEFFVDVPGPFSLKAGKVSSPSIADIQGQLCEDSPSGYYHPEVREASNNYLTE